MSIDPVCLLHGKKLSEHEFGFCLYCCLCFKTLVPDECHVTADGVREDVCRACAEKEVQMRVETLAMAAIRLKSGEIIVGPTHAKALERQQRAGREIANDEFDTPAGYGFITNTGRFITVYAAWDIAATAGQLKLGGSDGMPQELRCRRYLISEYVIFNR